LRQDSTGQDLLTQTVTITPTFTEVSTSDGRFYSVDGEVQANGGRPIVPRVSVDVAEDGTRARGILFSRGWYTDSTGFDPVIARPVTDTAAAEPTFEAAGWYPSSVATVNRVETAAATLERLVVTPGQYAEPATQRLWHSLTYDVYYSMADDEVHPTVWRVDSSRLATSAWFAVEVTDDSGVERVVVTYSVGDGQWESVDLSPAGSGDRWKGRLALTNGKESVHFFVQAVDLAGNVTTSNNKGEFFEPLYKAYLPVVLRAD
jgi:hypothetical protein